MLLKEVGERREASFAQQDHLALGTQLDIIDFETGATVAGAKCASAHGHTAPAWQTASNPRSEACRAAGVHHVAAVVHATCMAGWVAAWRSAV